MASIGTSSTELIAAAKGKSKLIIANRGSTTVWVKGQGETAVVNEGFPIDENDKLVLTKDNGAIDTQFNAISESGTVTVTAYRL